MLHISRLQNFVRTLEQIARIRRRPQRRIHLFRSARSNNYLQNLFYVRFFILNYYYLIDKYSVEIWFLKTRWLVYKMAGCSRVLGKFGAKSFFWGRPNICDCILPSAAPNKYACLFCYRSIISLNVESFLIEKAFQIMHGNGHCTVSFDQSFLLLYQNFQRIKQQTGARATFHQHVALLILCPPSISNYVRGGGEGG